MGCVVLTWGRWRWVVAWLPARQPFSVVVAFRQDDRGSRCVSQWDWVNSSGTRTWMMEAPVNPANASFQSATMKQRRGSLHYFHTRLGRFMTSSICIGSSWLRRNVFRASRKSKLADINKCTRDNSFYFFSSLLLNKRITLLWLSYNCNFEYFTENDSLTFKEVFSWIDSQILHLVLLMHSFYTFLLLLYPYISLHIQKLWIILGLFQSKHSK